MMMSSVLADGDTPSRGRLQITDKIRRLCKGGNIFSISKVYQ